MSGTPGFDIGIPQIDWGSAQKPYSGGQARSGEGFEVEPVIEWGSGQKPYIGGYTFAGNGLVVEPVIEWGSYQKPYFGYTLIGTTGQKFGVHALPVTPGDDAQLIVMDDLWNPKLPRTHTVTIENGIIKSWAIVNGGAWPAVHNTHTITIQNGLITAWTITPDGAALPVPTKRHTLDVEDGWVKTWDIV